MIRHLPELITLKKGKLIGLHYIVLMDLLPHTDAGSLEFLGKIATIPQYVLVVVDLYSLKVYVYRMRSRTQILQKMKLIYDEETKEKINV